MKKLVIVMMIIELAATAALGTMLYVEHEMDALSILVPVEVQTEVLVEDTEMKAELTARKILGNELAEDMYKRAMNDGRLTVDQRNKDGVLVRTTMIPVCETRSAWEAVALYATDYYRAEYTVIPV